MQPDAEKNNDLISKNEALVPNNKLIIFLNSYVTLFFFIISQFKPRSVISLADYYQNSIFNGIDNLWILAQVVSFLMISYIYTREFKINLFNITFYLSLFYISMVSFLNGAPIDRIISIILSPLSLLMLIELAYQYKVIDKLMKVIYTYFGGLIILNYISMLIFPDSFYTDYRGMDVTWIFGNYQQNFNWFVVFIAISFYVKTIWREYIKYINVFVYILIILTTLRVWSATTLSALAIVFGLLLCYRLYPKISIFLNPFYAYLTGIITTILITGYNIQEYFAFFIETILQKSVNFTGRMRLWGNAIDWINEKPLFGHGIEMSAVTFSKIGKTTAHNHYLNLIYNGGMIYLVLTCILVYIVAVKTRKYRYNNSIMFINVSLIGYFVYFLAEAKINLDIFILLLASAYYISKILEDNESEYIMESKL